MPAGYHRRPHVRGLISTLATVWRIAALFPVGGTLVGRLFLAALIVIELSSSHHGAAQFLEQ